MLESVNTAIEMLDNSAFRGGGKIRVSLSEFGMKGDFYVPRKR